MEVDLEREWFSFLLKPGREILSIRISFVHTLWAFSEYIKNDFLVLYSQLAKFFSLHA